MSNENTHSYGVGEAVYFVKEPSEDMRFRIGAALEYNDELSFTTNDCLVRSKIAYIAINSEIIIATLEDYDSEGLRVEVPYSNNEISKAIFTKHNM